VLVDDAKMAPRLFFAEDPSDDPLCHRQQREGEARDLVAWVKQQLRQAAFGAEHAIARHYVIANQKTVEVLAHRGREGFEFLRLSQGAPGVTKDRGVAAQLLVEKRDGPTACHPVALRRIDRLKRVV